MKNPWRGARVYPFLFAAFPALAMIAANADQVEIGVVLRPLLLSLLLCAVLYALLVLILRRPEPAALLTTWALLLFFTYGHAYTALRGATLAGEVLGRHRYLATLWLLLLVAGAWWSLRRQEWGRLPRILTAVSLISVALPVVQLATFVVESSILAAEREGSRTSPAGLLPEGQALKAPGTGALPDIYYIILDGYGRADTLKRVYGYDNTEFLEGLERLGFVVAGCSQSNYAQTEMSIATSTNLEYLDGLGDSFRPGTDNRRPLRPLIVSSAARLALESLGYRTVAFDTGFSFINLEDADRYISLQPGGGLNSFELMFLRSTAGLVLFDRFEALAGILEPELHRPDDYHRDRVRYIFDELERLAAEKSGPRYVYAHIVSPHEPYLFDAAGNAVDRSEAEGEAGRKAYADQARFISRRTLQMLQTILADSETPPVILLQADHGPGENSAADRMRILNAYLFPGAGQVIDAGITPVSSFRMVFNAVFGTSFARLPDVSYFSVYPAPFDFTIVPPSCPS